jgi:hypothetical protein
MSTLTAPQGYRPGGTWGICDRCAFKHRLTALKFEWTGFRVCNECWDPEPADLRAPNIYPEGLPVRDARPEQPVDAPSVVIITPPPPPPPPPPPAPRFNPIFYWMGVV